MSRSALGTLRHRLTLQAPVETSDGAGGVTRSWTSAALLWAAIEPASQEAFIAGEAQAERATHRITMRYRSDVDGSKRLVKGSRVFRILTAFDPDERRARLALLVEEIGS